MSFLRTISTRRLSALVGASVLVAAGGTAIALGASGGPVPPSRPLAVAVHDALVAPEVQGVTARIKFTNHLIDAASLEGADPLLKGASGRLWAADGHLRVELQSDRGDSQVVSDGKSFWAYDVGSHTVYRGGVPRGAEARSPKREGPPSLRQVQSEIGRVVEHAGLSGAIPGDVAGQPAYTVRVSPKHDGGLVGAGEVGWDAVRGVPLRVAVFARGNGSPVLELSVTHISYGPVRASDFAVSPPHDAKVVELSPPKGARSGDRASSHELSGTAAAGKALPFKLSAPSSLVGSPRREVRLIHWEGKPGALVTYGRGLGGIAVVERRAERARTPRSRGREDSGSGLTLPRVSINGAPGDLLATALGTMVRFDRDGVSYVVVGSVSRGTAEAAARSLLP